MVENIARELVTLAWDEVGGDRGDIQIEKGAVKVPIQKAYLEGMHDDRVKNHIETNIKDHVYTFRIDVPVYVRDKLVMAIECKLYTENAMLKRILFDGSLIKRSHPHADIVLFQLESQLGGDYSEIFKEWFCGSPRSHVLMSYFNYHLNIVTLLEGERKVNKPTHKLPFFKVMEKKSLEKALLFFKSVLVNCVNR